MSDPESLSAEKCLMRQEALQRRDAGVGPQMQERLGAELSGVLKAHEGKVLAGYLAMGSEADPLAVMRAWKGPVCVPAVVARGEPLEFRRWSEGCALEGGPLHTRHPVGRDLMRPAVVLVPLLAFDRRLYRLGYGGGFYDRTIAGLRHAAPDVITIGIAFALQEVTHVPRGVHDQALDLIVTDEGIVQR